MLKMIISGCNGKMGRAISKMCENDERITVVAGIDIKTEKLGGYPVYTDLMEYGGRADVVVDFSSVANLSSLLSCCVKKKIPIVLCTTGFGTEDARLIEEAAKKIPIFKSGNMSLGVNLVIELAKKAARALGGDFDVEIVERHHGGKLDAPSGTALMIADAVSAELPYETQYVYDRTGALRRRGKAEIGISSVRGGTIVGEHEIIFAGYDEVIEIKHTALSRELFAAGALKAALFMAGVKKPGMYNMSDIISEGCL